MREPSQRLGRGLASLLGEIGQPTAASPVGTVAVDALEPSSFQPRGAIDPATLTDLATSIQARGILQPLLVRPHPSDAARYQIIAGERRWRAARQAGLTLVPCLVRTMTDADATAAALVENLQRVDLNPIEEAEGFHRLIAEHGLTQEELGVAIGKSRSHVANALRLLGLPSSAADHVRAGRLSAGHARAALACADPAAAVEIILARQLSVREAEQLSTVSPRLTAAKRVKPTARPDPNRLAVEADLSEQLGMAVTINWNGSVGSVKIAFASLDQLDHIVARLGRS